MSGWANHGKPIVRAPSRPGMFTRWPCASCVRSVFEHEGRSKRADEFRDMPFDLVVTVCDDAAENCPVWLGRGRRVHLGFPDPAKATGSEEEVLVVFRQVRDDIAVRMNELLSRENLGT